jgi:hypothetical protein
MFMIACLIVVLAAPGTAGQLNLRAMSFADDAYQALAASAGNFGFSDQLARNLSRIDIIGFAASVKKFARNNIAEIDQLGGTLQSALETEINRCQQILNATSTEFQSDYCWVHTTVRARIAEQCTSGYQIELYPGVCWQEPQLEHSCIPGTNKCYRDCPAGYSEPNLGLDVDSIPFCALQPTRSGTCQAPYPNKYGVGGINRCFKATMDSVDDIFKPADCTTGYFPWGPICFANGVDTDGNPFFKVPSLSQLASQQCPQGAIFTLRNAFFYFLL